ncbi:GTP-binding protein [Staphylococcus simiae]|uniref:CobW family GTP-binding protein n=1 Tax=Staphylococcus simiae TaxID=308354 RepID=UPI001A95DEB1|nr:GTP-binding protein [Staphylococcus simiae]MBO1198863.1 GTP-binding protein [Staphylococcus simiae]MBO1201060.1 GTP-binding protein [Staphylococcus simiae]MBO1204019.1 GTP-binding protein [Staphylococcus simiae]MBO1211100.1 GTP-binding protein [Staphylococcus simiae]MBO1229347.1 GTP-binding protein [Staphylococcus simiae]
MKKIKNEKIKITIINGFLGSGKTTLLTQYIHELLKNDEKVNIIMNEFGSFDIDSNHIADDIEVRSLINGCVCCDLKQDLVNEMQALIKSEKVEHIIIEATGIAHPLEIMVACQDPLIVNYCEKPYVIGVLDAKRFLGRSQYSDNTVMLMEEQLKLSDAIVINKIDLVDEDALEIILSELQDINPGAIRFEVTYGDINFDQLTSNNDRIDMTHQHIHHHSITSLKYTFTGPIERQLFYQFILKLPDNVLRLKGYVRFKDATTDIYEFQYAYGLPEYGIVSGNLPLTIVIIGEDIDVNQLRNQLDMLQFT